MFTNFGNAFVKITENYYISKINQLQVYTEDGMMGMYLTIENNETFEYLNELAGTLNTTVQIFPDNSVGIMIQQIEIPIDEEDPIMQWVENDNTYERMVICKNSKRIQTMIRDNSFAIQLIASDEKTVEMMKNNVFSNLYSMNEYYYSNIEPFEEDNYFIEIEITDGFVFENGIYKIRNDLKQLLKNII